MNTMMTSDQAMNNDVDNDVDTMTIMHCINWIIIITNRLSSLSLSSLLVRVRVIMVVMIVVVVVVVVVIMIMIIVSC